MWPQDTSHTDKRRGHGRHRGGEKKTERDQEEPLWCVSFKDMRSVNQLRFEKKDTVTCDRLNVSLSH